MQLKSFPTILDFFSLSIGVDKLFIPPFRLIK